METWGGPSPGSQAGKFMGASRPSCAPDGANGGVFSAEDAVCQGAGGPAAAGQHGGQGTAGRALCSLGPEGPARPSALRRGRCAGWSKSCRCPVRDSPRQGGEMTDKGPSEFQVDTEQCLPW